MMICRLYALLIASTSLLTGASIRGNVVENQTGRALARASVSLQPVAGTPGNSVSAQTSIYGAFEFGALAPGAYLIKASRRGFVPAEYGQKLWNSAGTPLIIVKPDESPFITLRLPRYGSISGTVVDENEVGIPQHEVVVYRATQPPLLVARGVSDDRGVYRVAGLEPGNYYVRTGAKQDEGIEYVPTFARETLRMDESKVVQVFLDQDSGFVDVRPLPGRLFTLSGVAEPQPPTGPVTVTLASDMGRMTVTGPVFRFPSLAPGLYELFAETQANPALGIKYQSAYQQMSIYREPTPVAMNLRPVEETRILVSPEVRGAEVQVRRKDYAGVQAVRTFKVPDDRPMLSMGRWELLLTPATEYYVSGFSGPYHRGGPRPRPDGWNEIAQMNHYSNIRFTLSQNPGTIAGVVKSARDPVVGAPVFLEGHDPVNRQRVLDLRTVRTDMQGRYRFEGLAPGTYRLLSTFEFRSPDSSSMDVNATQSVLVEAGATLDRELDLYVIR